MVKTALDDSWCGPCTVTNLTPGSDGNPAWYATCATHHAAASIPATVPFLSSDVNADNPPRSAVQVDAFKKAKA
jgi:hypothetical protein